MELAERISKLPIDIQDIIYKKHYHNTMNKVINELDKNYKVKIFIEDRLGFGRQDYEKEEFDLQWEFVYLSKDDFDTETEYLEALKQNNIEKQIAHHRQAIDHQNADWHDIMNGRIEEWKCLKNGLSMLDLRLHRH